MMYTFRMLLLFLAMATGAVQATMQGDAEAIEMAEQIVESIGGAETWSNIRSLHMIEKSRSINGDGINGEFWRDLVVPRERYTLRNRKGDVFEFWWDERGVWQLVNGKLNSELPADLHQEVMSYWHGEIYVMYHRFARADEDLHLVKNEDNSFTAHSLSQERELGTFWLNGDKQLYRWRHQDGTEYIYGPHKKFGDISFPDWGTQVDGSWSFYYEKVVGSQEPPTVSFEPPVD
jgi:hypothetical protein